MNRDKMLRFEEMDSEALRALLLADMEAPEGEQLAPDVLAQIAEVLAAREAEAGEPDVARARAEFVEHYYPLVDDQTPLYDWGDYAGEEQRGVVVPLRRVERKSRVGYMLRRGLAVAVVVLMAVVVSVTAFMPRESAIAVNMIVSFYDKYLSVGFTRENADVELPEIKVAYIPAGYEVLEEKIVVGDRHKLLRYTNELGERLSIDVWVAYKGLSYNPDIEGRVHSFEKLASGVEAQLLLSTTTTPSTLFWNSADGQLFFTISGSLGKAELLAVANGIGFTSP